MPAPTVQPIIVQAIDAAPAKELGLGEIIVQAIGLTGLILVASVLLGLALGALLFWMRKRQARDRREGEAGDQIRLRLEPPTEARTSEART